MRTMRNQIFLVISALLCTSTVYGFAATTANATLTVSAASVGKRFWYIGDEYSRFLKDVGEYDIDVGVWSTVDISKAEEDMWKWPKEAEIDMSLVSSAETRTVYLKHNVLSIGIALVSSATATQTIFKLRDGSYILDERSSITGVPFSSQFAIHQRLCARPVSEEACTIKGWVSFDFKESVGRIMKGIIQRVSASECQGHHNDMAEYAGRMLPEASSLKAPNIVQKIVTNAKTLL